MTTGTATWTVTLIGAMSTANKLLSPHAYLRSFEPSHTGLKNAIDHFITARPATDGTCILTDVMLT
ncbi:hypothetical protein BV911_06945 [Pseudoruegeria sp. SK021]|nr:hypothetical protein BV911_06945 [Pseudoruegeria sp. SK021]